MLPGLATMYAAKRGWLGLAWGALAFCMLSLDPAAAWGLEPLSLESSKHHYNLLPHLELLEDAEGGMGLEEAAAARNQHRYKPVSSQTLRLGQSASAWWLRFSLDRNRAGSVSAPEVTWLLELAKPVIDRVELYQPRPPGQEGWSRASIGAGFHEDQGHICYRTTVLELDDDFDPSRPFYLRLASRVSLSMPVRIWSLRGFVEYAFRDSLVFGVIFGVMAALLLSNLLLFISLRDRAYIFYVFYLAGMLLTMAVLQGHMKTVAHGLGLDLSLAQQLSLAFCMFFAALFSRAFLDLGVNAPRLNRLLDLFLLGSLVMAGLAASGRYVWANNLGYTLALLGPLHAIASSLICLRKGFQPARFFLAAWLALMVGVLGFALISLGVMGPRIWSVYLLPAGVVAEAMLLTLALTHRIRTLRKEREKLASSQRRLQLLSLTDSLTGLYNRRYFDSKLASEMGHAARLDQPLSLIMADLDDFKAFNDAWGHPEGDKVLAQLGAVIAASVREGDAACRYGGEEFAVVLPGSGVEEALAVAQRMGQAFGQTVFRPAKGQAAAVTVSMGVAQMRPGENGLGLVSRADRAMYLAKAQGKNQALAAP